MKTLSVLIFQFFIISQCFSQPGRWTWLKGDTIPNTAGNFGTLGVPGPANLPPALYEACEWTDLNGKFWIYGGREYVSTSNLNDLWRYDPVTNEWTWMKGTHVVNDPGNFGVQGVPAATNNPPGLAYAPSSWVDQSGNLWLFGGYGTGSYSDLWMYNIATNNWTWMKGPGVSASPGVYGTRTVPHVNNFPASRAECSATWIDANNDLWLFGGWTSYNDLWKYDIASNTWTWMKGSNNIGSLGHYGTMGVEDSLNTPGGREAYTRWIDQSGNLWFYGGSGIDSTGINSDMGDLWKYNPLTNNWTWISGSPTVSGAVINYGTRCVANSTNSPPRRKEGRAAWNDSNGDFWMFGGAYWSSPGGKSGLNDLWKYCVTDNKWIWVSGDSLPNSNGIWGTQGVSTAWTKPSERFGSNSFRINNELYLFSGWTGPGNFLNDMWKFEIDTSCAPCNLNILLPLPSFTASDSSFCEGVCVNFNNHSINALTYQWNFPGGTPSSDTTANPHICYNHTGTYPVTLTASNSMGSNSITRNNTITVLPPVAFAPLNQIGDSLFSIPGYVSYKWFLDTAVIIGATNYFYVATQNGTYILQVVDSNGCEAAATLLNVIASAGNQISPENNFTIIIAENAINIKLNADASFITTIQLSDELGQEILSRKIHLNQGDNYLKLDNIKLSSGIYFLTLTAKDNPVVKKFFIK